MINRIMKRFALSREGAKGLVCAVAACTVGDIVLMFPVGLLYFLVSDFLEGAVPKNHYGLYGAGIAVALLLIFISEFWKYNATYFSTYRESGRCRIRLAEKLRRLPLSFFGKKDLADLTNTMLGDVATTEQMFSHYVPQYYASIISTCLIAISLFFYDWRLALAALWVLPVALAIVGTSKKAQNYFSRKQNMAQIAVQDGVQECLETVRDLKSNNAEEEYLRGLYQKIDTLESRHMKSELGTAMFVVPAQMILKLGIASVALVGSMLLMNGTLTLITFFMFLLVVSRIYEPMSFSLQNLAAMNSLQINIDRMNEIENCKEQEGKTEFQPKGYDISFENVGFAYNTEETVLQNVSFTAKQGEVTALIGPSGGGKSTATKLAARFWDADKGKITVGGVDVKTVDPERLLTAFFRTSRSLTIRSWKISASEERMRRMRKSWRRPDWQTVKNLWRSCRRSGIATSGKTAARFRVVSASGFPLPALF